VLTALAGHGGDSGAPGSVSVPVHHPVVPVSSGHRSGTFMDQVVPVPAGGGHLSLTVPDWVQHLVEDLTGMHAVMALAHLAAAAVVGLWLAAGERALWSLLTFMARPVVEIFAVLLGSALRWARNLVASLDKSRVRLRPAAWGGTRPACAVFLPDTLTRRGPPALVVS
jgi:hypothetical protein